MADAPDPADLIWTEEGAPRSRRFDDVYFSDDGLTEARAVFLDGCGLPDAWRGRERFTVAELGFGSGLNILALLHLWRSTRPPGGRLHVFSVEAFLMGPEDAARALSAFPEIADLAHLLLQQWPQPHRGWVRLEFPALGAVIDLALEEAGAALAGWSGRADAWFLDGFAPSRNPEMWRSEVLDLVAARSAPDARLATFTVAGEVRRGLAERAFSVERRPGHGRKKQRLEARLDGQGPEAPRPPPAVAIIGAGIAGASLARAFAAQGAACRVYDPDPGGGASGAPAALAAPRLDVGDTPASRLYAQAALRAWSLYRLEAPDAVLAQGALHLSSGERDPARFQRLGASDLFPKGALEPLSPDAAAARLGEPATQALWMAGALTLRPAAVLQAWLPPVERRRVAAIARDGERWRLVFEDGAVAEADVVCLASGPAARDLADLELEAVRGQLTWSAPLAEPPAAASWGGYAVPTPEGGVLFGATHQRGRDDIGVAEADERANLASLAARRPGLAQAALQAGLLRSRAGVRAATPDRLPLAGALGPGLMILGGLGGRGFTTAPLLAEHVVALALGAPSPLPENVAGALAPGRFQARAARRRLPNSVPPRSEIR